MSETSPFGAWSEAFANLKEDSVSSQDHADARRWKALLAGQEKWSKEYEALLSEITDLIGGTSAGIIIAADRLADALGIE